MSAGQAGAALGVLDWGIGGLGFVAALGAHRPGTPVVYLSDSGAVPYGKLARSALTARVQHAVDALVAHGAAQVVIACNAASSVAADLVAPVPITPIVAAAVASVPGSLAGTLWVLGGLRTVRSGIYQRALRRAGLRVRGRVAQPLSAHVEAGRGASAACAEDLARVLAPVADGEAILLACTHYPALRAQLEALRPESPLLDPATELAIQVARGLMADLVGPSRFVTTGDPAAMARAAEAAWGLRLADIVRTALPG